VVTHQLQVARRTGKVRRPETDVLPLSDATNGSLVDTNEGKAELFAKKRFYTSSNENHNDTFLSHKHDMELNHKELFENNIQLTLLITIG